MRKKESLELENDIIFFNNLIDRYSLDTFNVNKTECDFLEKLVLELSYDICNDVFEFCDNNPRRIMTVLSVIAAETRTNKGFHNFVLNKRQKKELKEQFYSANQLGTIGFVK